MSSAPPGSANQRPREVFIAGTLTVAASAAILFALVTAMTQLNSAEMHQSLEDFADTYRDSPFPVDVETAKEIFRYTIMAFSVMSGTALVLGIYVLKRHRGARIALTCLGMVTAIWPLFMGPIGWLITLNIAVTLILLWTRPARMWFDQLDGPPRPAGPRTDRSDPRLLNPPAQPPAPPASPPEGWPPPSGWGPAPPSPGWPPPSGWRPTVPPAEESPSPADGSPSPAEGSPSPGDGPPSRSAGSSSPDRYDA